MLSTSSPRSSVLTFGDPLISFVPDAPGRLSISNSFQPFVGGAELNTAVGLARLGVPVAYASVVGDDAFGQIIRRALLAERVNIDFLQSSTAGRTGVLFKQWTGIQQTTSVFYYRDSAPMALGAWDPSGVAEKLTNESVWSWLHVTGITCMLSEAARRQAESVIQIARKAGLTVSFDVNIRLKLGTLSAWRDCSLKLAPHLNWFIAGDEEANWLFESSDSVEVERKLRDVGFAGQGVILKRGAQGAESSCHGTKTEVAAWPVHQMVDTVGAGDGFNAGWIAGMQSGKSMYEALRLGSLVGAYAVTSRGDYDGYPARNDIEFHMNGTGDVQR